MPTPHPNANGHRRRELVKRVKATETHCSLCGEWVDKSLTMLPGTHGPRCKGNGCKGCVPHPRRAEVDEDIPRSRGGSPTQRSNTSLMCRRCNQFKGDSTLAEARVRWKARRATQVDASEISTTPIW